MTSPKLGILFTRRCARVLNCLLQRTGIDDHIGDWGAFVASNPDEVDPQGQARDLTYSYSKPRKPEDTPSHRTYRRLFRRLPFEN
jgi:hypothetical protein